MLILKDGTTDFEGTDVATTKIIITGLEKAGHTVRNSDQDKSYVISSTQKAVDDAFQKRNQQLEDTIKEMTGVDKSNATEKYYDYFKRAIELKNTELSTVKMKVKEYEEKGTNGNVLAEEYKKQVTALQTQLAASQTDFAGQIAKKNEEVFKTRFSSQLSASIARVTGQLRGDIAKEFLPDIIRAKTAEFESQFIPKDVEGVTLFHNNKGEPVMDKKDGKPKSVDQLVDEIFSIYIDPKRSTSGAGSGNGKGTQAVAGTSTTTPPWKEAVRPDTIKSQVQVAQWLSADLKLQAGTKDFDDAFSQHIKNADGKALPMKAVIS